MWRERTWLTGAGARAHQSLRRCARTTPRRSDELLARRVLKQMRTMEPRDEGPLFPETLIHPAGAANANPRGPRADEEALEWDDAGVATSARGKLDEIKAMIEGKSPGEIFAMARTWCEERPLATTAIGFGLGFTLGRLLRRS